MLMGVALSVISALPSGTAQAAVRGEEPIVKPSTLKRAPSLAPSPALVLRVQRALAGQGFYKGLVNGKMNRETERAIRTYQSQAGLALDPRITEKLISELETGVQVGSLLNRLQNVREQQIKSARDALLSRPETKALAHGFIEETANPTRDARPCFQNPTVRCLLVEAIESAKAIHKPEMRDWALGEVLVAQARAGLANDAMQTVRRIRDPRLIMVALGNIAEAEARAGRFNAAITAASIIPDAKQQADSFSAIASIEVEQTGKAGKALKSLIAAIKRVSNSQNRIGLTVKVAHILWQAGDKKGANKKIASAQARALREKTELRRNTAMGHIAIAYAETGQPERAVEILKKIRDVKNHGSVLVSAATAHVQAGAVQEALLLADNIDAVRYRAVVLSRIAAAQARTGNEKAANVTIDRAVNEAGTIRFPYAKDYAWSKIALAVRDLALTIKNENRNAAFNRAIAAAGQIKDNQLRAHVLWTLSADRRRVGDEAGAEASDAIAMRATEAIKSVLSRVWVYGDIAYNHAERRERDQAWKAFRAGLSIAENLQNAWGRARALGKLATTLMRLDDTGGALTATAPSEASKKSN